MIATRSWTREVAGPLLLGAVLIAGLAIRLAVLDVPGHGGDVIVVSRWAERLAEHGPTGFYSSGGGSIYPTLLYFYWPIGVAFDGEALARVIKGLATPFDLLIGVVLFEMVSRRAGDLRGAAAAALYILNPAVILAGPVWGQIDAAGALAMLGVVWAAAGRRYALAGGLSVAAGLIKPQFGFVLLPVVVMAALEWWHARRPGPIARVAVGGLAAYAVIAGPLLLTPWDHVANVVGVTGIRPEASVHAPNPWGMLLGYEQPDTGLGGIGAGLLAIGLLAAQMPLLRRRDLRTLLAVAAFVIFAFYFLPTRVHERYLFPAMAVLAPLAAVSRPILAAYLAMTAAFALSLLYALVDTTPFTLPRAWELVLVTDIMVWGMGLVLLGAAVTIVLQLARGAGGRLADPG